MVEHDDSSSKPIRRWFRFRFGLRTLLLFTAVVAVLLGVESKRAADQNAIVARVHELGGQCRRTPREWIPQFLHRLLDESQRSTVAAFSVRVVRAPTGTGPNGPWRFTDMTHPEEVEELLRMPAMAHVRKLELVGTSVTDDVLDELGALNELEEIQYSCTSLAQDDANELRALLPNCRVLHGVLVSIDGSTPMQRLHLTYSHDAALAFTDDLSVFVRANRGDSEAVKFLLDAASGERARLYHTFLVKFFSRIDRQVVLPHAADALRNGTKEIRGLAVKILADRGAVDLLAEALHDPETSIRLEAVHELAKLGGDAASNHLSVACRDTAVKVREAALRQLPTIAGRDALPVYVRALEDPVADIRWQAIRAIERNTDAQAVEPLIVALNDENSLVRCSAARVLGKIGDPHAVASLTAKATEDEDSFVRKAAEEALAKIQ